MFQTDLLWQNDSRWAATTLGYGPQAIKDWGCLTTALTMVLNGCGYGETPDTVSQKMVAIGAFHGAAINAFRIGEAFPGLALGKLVDCESSPAPLAAIDAELEAGKPVLACVDQSPAAGVQDHWVVLVGKEGDDYLMLDPWGYKGDAPGKPNYLTQRYRNNGGTPDKEITQVMFLTISGKPVAASTAAPAASTSPSPAPVPSAPAPAPAPVAKKTLPADAVRLNPTTDGLAFRGAPDISGPLLRRVPQSTEFKSLEERQATLQKVGCEGLWINVQAPEGDQGYVAAWYVTAPEAPAAAPAPTSNITTVKVIEDQLAFRSQPVIAENTLITRFPKDTVLTVIDPQANQKIGVVNQWLKVKDSSGREGYVAAWYVNK